MSSTGWPWVKSSHKVQTNLSKHIRINKTCILWPRCVNKVEKHWRAAIFSGPISVFVRTAKWNVFVTSNEWVLAFDWQLESGTTESIRVCWSGLVDEWSCEWVSKHVHHQVGTTKRGEQAQWFRLDWNQTNPAHRKNGCDIRTRVSGVIHSFRHLGLR